jgi:hypothetical protein
MISVFYAILFAFMLVAATVIIHYEVLNSTSKIIPHLHTRFIRGRMLLVMTGIFIAHLLEISLYAGAYYVMNDHWNLGTIEGVLGPGGNYLDYFYFSLTSYTTLGVGDLYPTGPIRIVVGAEALNGFVLIGWSASYTFIAMQRFWRETRVTKGSARTRQIA